MPTFPTNATFTPRLQLPRPGLDDPADGPDGFNDLTDVLDPIIAGYAAGTTAARPAGYAGQFYWNTDSRTLQFYNGTAWVAASGGGSVAAAQPILDVGMVGQIRAGRQLAVADFTALGLSQPLGLWNLSDLTNLGSDGTALANKGTVPFGVGINGAATTSAVFAGSASQALYIAGASAGNYNVTAGGSLGCWFRTAKRGSTMQTLFSKQSTATGNWSWELGIDIQPNIVRGQVWATGGTPVAWVYGVSDVADDRWHFAVLTIDGAVLSLYVDGVLEVRNASAMPFAGTGPLNIGGFGADSGAAAGQPFYGRIDEAFVTADVLSGDQVRCLYAARLTHTLGAVPADVRLNVTRRRRAAALVVGDFPATPLRLYNFTAGDLVGVGSDTTGNRTLTPFNTLVVSGADGTPNGAIHFTAASSATLSGTDAGLPNLLASRSYGMWFKTATVPAANMYLIAWAGTVIDAVIRPTTGLLLTENSGDAITGPFVCDGQWHHMVEVEDNNAGDGLRRKLYLDGRCVGSSTVMSSLTLGGTATSFRLGVGTGGGGFYNGQMDGVFITGTVLTAADVTALYAKSSPALAPSPKNAGDHVETMTATDVLFTGDGLESHYTIDLGVTA